MFFVDRLKHFHTKNRQKFNIFLKSKHFLGAFDVGHHVPWGRNNKESQNNYFWFGNVARMESQISQCTLLVKGSMKTTIHLSTMIDKMKLTFLTRIFWLKIACVCVCDLIEWLADLYVQYVVVTYATLVNFCA